MAAGIGDRVAALRRRRGMSQSRLAALLPLSSSYVSLIESGKRRPAAQVLERLAETLGCSVDYLRGTGDDPLGDNDLRLRMAELALLDGDPAAARAAFGAILADRVPGGAPAPDHAQELEALWGRARADLELRDAGGAVAALTSLLGQAELPPTVSATAVRAALCRAYAARGDIARAVESGEAMLAEISAAERSDGASGWPAEVTDAADLLVRLHSERGDLDRARAVIGSLGVVVGAGSSLPARAATHAAAASAASDNGEGRHARHHAERALALRAELTDIVRAARLRVTTAAVMLRHDTPPPYREVAATLEAAVAELLAAGAPAPDVARAEIELARVRILVGDSAGAVAVAGSARRRLGGEHSLQAVTAQVVLAEALLEAGDAAAATRVVEAARDALRAVGSDARDALAAWRGVADLLAQLGSTRAAVETYRLLAGSAGARANPAPGATVPADCCEDVACALRS